MPKAAVVGTLFGVAILAVVIYLSMGLTQYSCEVCVEFNGRQQCRTASGTDERTAIRTAHDNACAFLITSKTEGFLCTQTPPSKVVCQKQ